MKKTILGVILGISFLAGCVEYPSPPVQPSTPELAVPASGTPASGSVSNEKGKRTYTLNVQPITKTCSATSCHSGTPLGKYDVDKGISVTSRSYMINGAGLTDEQKQVIKDWIAADTPNDPKTF